VEPDPEKPAPDVTPDGGTLACRKSHQTLSRIHRAASRLKDGKPAVGVAPVRATNRGRFYFR
jgi:hypothetical protein